MQLCETTPRRRLSRVAYVDGQREPLHHETELALLFGRGVHGITVELHHVDGWRRAWADWRDVIEPKCDEYLPGIRPMARYVLGELPVPPVVAEPPLAHRFFREWISGTGRFWTRYPEPYQTDETSWLMSIGEVDSDEHDRYLARMRIPRVESRGKIWSLLHDYPLEVGLYA